MDKNLQHFALRAVESMPSSKMAIPSPPEAQIRPKRPRRPLTGEGSESRGVAECCLSSLASDGSRMEVCEQSPTKSLARVPRQATTLLTQGFRGESQGRSACWSRNKGGCCQSVASVNVEIRPPPPNLEDLRTTLENRSPGLQIHIFTCFEPGGAIFQSRSKIFRGGGRGVGFRFRR